MFKRFLNLPARPQVSFFLWGPRQTGKSTLLQEKYPNAIKIDLLKTSEFIRYTQAPYLLREELIATREKQLVLIDEVHWLIENNGNTFGLCGSSARKLKRGHANLLGGRAIRYELFGFIARELKEEFNLIRMINQG